MISAWWLFLIVPVSVFTGFTFAALCHVAHVRDSIND